MPTLHDTVVKFNDCINDRDIKRLARLMAVDHRFIDSEGNTDSGKANCLKAWTGFFKQFPDYQNVFTVIVENDQQVNIAGYSTCSVEILAGAALWSARITDGKVAVWRVYTDTPDNRKLLNLPNAEET